MIGFEFLNQIGGIQKSIKNPIFKKKFSSYNSFFVINKNVFFVKKLITHKLNGNFFEKNHDNA